MHVFKKVSFLLLSVFKCIYSADSSGLSDTNHSILDNFRCVTKHKSFRNTFFGECDTVMYRMYLDGESEVAYITYGRPNSMAGAKILHLSVAKEFRGKGIGAAILHCTMRELKTYGYPFVVLSAEPIEASQKEYEMHLKKLISFYQRNGFELVRSYRTNALMKADLK